MNQASRPNNPFPGLRAFQPEEDYLFFGREEQTIELLQRLATHRFVAVVGSSGSGKSSLVRCGLLSELLGGKMLQAGASWEVAVTHPGGNPLALLTEALLEADLYDPDEDHARENLLATLSRSRFGLVEAIRLSDLAEDTNFLLVVDQFEEIFRFREAGQTQQEAAAEFVSLLLEAVNQEAVPVYVVLTMRSDFIGECSQFESLAEIVNRGEFLIPRLTREQYKRVIEGPIKVAGGEIAPRLLQRLLNDLGQQADQLPCLQHALMRTWEVSSDEEALDLDGYQRVGRMAEALSLHADEVFASLASDRARQLCQGAFQALTVKESENRGIRRPQRLGSLCEILEVSEEELIPVIDAFRQQGVTFLMPPVDVPLTQETIIDISHESLMRVWTHLRQWVEEEAQAAGIYRRLAESAELHRTGKAGLFRDPELGIALAWRASKRPNEAWATRYQPGFQDAMAFLDQSQEAAESEEKQREAQRQRQLEQAEALATSQARSAALFKRFTVVAAAGFLGAIGLSLWAFKLRNEARDASARAQHQEGKFWHGNALALSESHHHFSAKLMAARAIGFEGYGRESQPEEFQKAVPISIGSDSPERPAIEGFLNETPGYDLLWRSDWAMESAEPLRTNNNVSFSPDGRLLAAGEDDTGKIRIWDVVEGRLARTLHGHAEVSVREVFFSPNGRLLASVGRDNRVILWDTATWEPEGAPIHHSTLLTCAFSPDGKQLAVGGNQGVILWDIASRKAIRHFHIDGLVIKVLFHPSGKQLATMSFREDPENLVRIWDIATERPLASGAIGSITFAPNDEAFFLEGPSEIVEWDLGSWATSSALTETSVSDEPLRFEEAGGRKGSFSGIDGVTARALKVSPNSLLLAAGSGNQVVLWHRQTSQPLARLDLGAEAEGVAFSPDGRLLAATQSDGVISLWNVAPGKEAAVWPSLGSRNAGLAVSPDGLTFASAFWSDPRIFIRDSRTGSILHRLEGHEAYLTSLAYSPDGGFLVSSSEDMTLRVWDPVAGVMLGQLDHHTRRSDCVAVSPDGRLIASGYLGLIKIFDTDSWELASSLEFEQVRPRSLAFASDSRTLFSGDNDGKLRHWEVSSGEQLTILDLYNDDIRALAVSPDGQWLAAGSDDDRAVLIDVATYEPVQRIQAQGTVRTTAFSPDGRWWATGTVGDDDTIRIRSVETGEALLNMGSPTRMLAFIDGNTLLSADRWGPLRVWHLDELMGHRTNYTRYANGPFALATHKMHWLPPREAHAEAQASPYFQEPRANYVSDLRNAPTPIRAHRSLFWRFLSTRNWTSARLQLDELRAKGVGDDEARAMVTALVHSAENLAASSTGDIAERRLRLALEIAPDASEAWALLAPILLQRGETAGAVEAFDRSLSDDTSILPHRTTLTACLNAILATPNLTLPQQQVAALLDHYIRASYPMDSRVHELPSIAAEQALTVQTTLENRVTLVPWTASWRYLDDGSEPPSSWYSPPFDDRSWASGVGKFGFSNNPKTLLRALPRQDEANVELDESALNGITRQANRSQEKIITYYFRHRFELTEIPERAHYIARVYRDDGFALYLNGQEALRDNLPEGPLNSQTRALLNVTGDLEDQILDFDIDPAHLRLGTNVVAVQLHQDLPTSTDVGFHMELLAADITPRTYVRSLSTEAIQAIIAQLNVIVPPRYVDEWTSELRYAFDPSADPADPSRSVEVQLARLRVLLSRGEREAASAGLNELEAAREILPKLSVMRQHLDEIRAALQ